MKSSLMQSVRELSAHERASLLRKIQTLPVAEEFSTMDVEQKGLYGAQTPIENIAEELEKDLGEESFWRRLFLRVISSFTMKSSIEAYRDYRLSQLMVSSGRGSLQGLVDLKDKKVKSTVFRKIYQIPKQAKILIPFFTCTSVQEEGVASIAFGILEKKILNPKEGISDFLSEEEILGVFKAGEKIDAEIKQILASKVEAYLRSIHPQIFKEMEERLESFTLTRFFVLFPYANLMTPFVGNINIDTKTEEELNSLARMGSSFDSIARPLERLSLHLGEYSEITLDFELFNQVFELYYREVASKTQGFEGVSEEAFKEDMRNKVISFYNNIKFLQKTLPIDVLLKIFKQDPYYVLEKSNVAMGPRIFEFYSKMLEAALLSEWNSSTKEVAHKYWLQEAKNFLSEDAITAIQYNPHISDGKEIGDLPSQGEIILLHFFLEKYGDSLFSYFLKTLMHVVLVNKTNYRNEVELQETTLSEFFKMERLSYNNFIKERRETFKNLAGIGEAEQKVIMNRWLATAETRNQKMLEDFYDFFRRLSDTFSMIQKAQDLSSVMNVSYTLNGHKITITEALSICYHTIEKYFSLVNLYKMKDKD